MEEPEPILLPPEVYQYRLDDTGSEADNVAVLPSHSKVLAVLIVGVAGEVPVEMLITLLADEVPQLLLCTA